MSKTKRKRFNHCGELVASSNIIRVALIRRFEITSRYKENMFGVNHCTLTFNLRENGRGF